MRRSSMSEMIYQGTTGTKVVELWVRKYSSDLPYYIKVNGSVTMRCDELRVAYHEYNEAFKED